MSTASLRLKTRPAILSIFLPTSVTTPHERTSPPQVHQCTSTSPLPRRESRSGSDSPARAQPAPAAAKMLCRPKSIRTYGDGTELDGIEDLPTDRDIKR
ncbi:hypothetical protein EXIGLDRAFT_736709 [Exidia glandulosa HHB12029]|uniref:Uncharacterized protein n=1 Tax=Exidia glandulosa HHB12029 TaxID=1314781 RepID=A0A165PCC0_EXIGL|nr:hypothetical protein EXIGLDRAFT_736709 [Exidia glandulosa HHB12029]